LSVARPSAILHSRADAQPEIVHARHAVYERETEPLLAYYERDARLQRQNGVGSIDEVWERVQRAISEASRRALPETRREKERTDEGTRVGQTAL